MSANSLLGSRSDSASGSIPNCLLPRFSLLYGSATNTQQKPAIDLSRSSTGLFDVRLSRHLSAKEAVTAFFIAADAPSLNPWPTLVGGFCLTGGRDHRADDP
jgi:hypothetical protein